MRYLLLAFTALAASCSLTPTQGEGDRTDLLRDFLFLQDGQAVQPVNGVVRIGRRPFEIRYLSKGKRPSIFASSNQETREQSGLLRDPLVTWIGTGAAAYPNDLHVCDDGLDLFEGWSDKFDKSWGTVFTRENRSRFDALRRQLPADPLVIMSGRNYTGFMPQPDGSQVYLVTRVDGKAFPATDHAFLYVVLFADDAPSDSNIIPHVLQWAPLVVEFTAGT